MDAPPKGSPQSSEIIEKSFTAEIAEGERVGIKVFFGLIKSAGVGLLNGSACANKLHTLHGYITRTYSLNKLNIASVSFVKMSAPFRIRLSLLSSPCTIANETPIS